MFFIKIMVLFFCFGKARLMFATDASGDIIDLSVTEWAVA
jgi:hypothetical protein